MLERAPEALHTLRTILRELRLVSKNKRLMGDDPVKYVFAQFRQHATTQRQDFKGHRQAQHLAETYAAYLTSTRKLNELHDIYFRGGELSIEETAGMVGLKMPKMPDLDKHLEPK